MASYLNLWPAIVFGWPSILAAIALSILGIVRRKPLAIIAAAIVAVPFSIYLAGTPGTARLGLMIPALLVGAGIAIRYRDVRMAWVLVTPVLVLTGWVAGTLLQQ